MRTSIKSVIGTVGFVVIFGALIGTSFEFQKTSRASHVLSNAALEWKDRIDTLGAAAAYDEFSLRVVGDVPGIQHQKAHTFGSALYAAEGEQGLSVCDARFSYGCFHEFLGRAIADLGLASVGVLNEGCINSLVTSPLSCQHGIGHGVLAFLGYTYEDLVQALGVCRELPYNDAIGGCYGGAFMEYNVQTMLGDEGIVRPVEDGDFTFPCNVVSEEYQHACAFWQSQWWHQVLQADARDPKEIYAQMGEFCLNMTDTPELERTCFEGIGNNLVADSGQDAVRAGELCDATTNQPEQNLYCKSYAANSFFVGGAGFVDDAHLICEGFSDEYLEYCLAYARNEANIANQIVLPSL